MAFSTTFVVLNRQLLIALDTTVSTGGRTANLVKERIRLC